MNGRFGADEADAGVAIPWKAGRREGPSFTADGGEILPQIVRFLREGQGLAKAIALDEGRSLVSAGSVSWFASAGDVVWCAGLRCEPEDNSIAGNIDVRAVRGPLTRAALLARGIQAPQVFGHPLHFLPDVLAMHRETAPSSDVLLVGDPDRMAAAAHPGPVLSATVEIRQLAQSISRAEFVVTDSLAAVAIADAFGVPCRVVRTSAPFTFEMVDYLLGTARADIALADSVDDAIVMGGSDVPALNREGLRSAFPHDLWTGLRSTAPASEGGYLACRREAQAQVDEIYAAIGPRMSNDLAQCLAALARYVREALPSDGITSEEARAAGIQMAHLAADTDQPDVLLSVVIPTHEVRPWITETLESVLAQDVERMQVIVVDDHSTDGTPEEVARIAATDNRVTLVNAVTRGGGSARNIGADHARGKYLIFCDGDDLVPRGAYRALVDSLARSGSDVAIGDYLKFSPADAWQPTASMPAYQSAATGTTLAERPSLAYSRPCWNKAFSRDFWSSTGIRFPDAPRSNDIVPMTKAYLFARSIDVVDDVVYLYRQRPGTSSMTAKVQTAGSALSYLEQETECARLLLAMRTPSMRSVYASLIYDRDGFFHLSKYLLDRGTSSADDERVSSAVARLLALTDAAPARIEPLKRLTVQFAALGEMAAATGAARLVHAGEVDEGRIVADAWMSVLPAVRAHAQLTSAADRALLLDGVRFLLKDLILELDIGEFWHELHRLALEVFGEIPELEDLCVPEATAAERSTRAELAARVSGSVTSVATGRELVLTGTTQLVDARLVPALYRPSDHGQTIRPTGVDWLRVSTHGEWSARFELATLPRREELAPVLVDESTDIAVPLELRCGLPDYAAMDPLVYRRIRGSLILERRLPWMIRAARRALIMAGERLSAVRSRRVGNAIQD